MQKSRLLELFKTLDKTEVKKLRKWVRSPFFNQREDVVLLFDYLDKNRPFEKPEKLSREYVFSKIFPKETYDEKKIGYAQSFLMTEIKKFITYQEFSADEMRPQIYMTRNLRKRGLNRHFESEWKAANELLEKQPLRNADFHFYNFQLQNEQHEYANSLSRKEPKGLQEASDELTNYFVAQKLKLGCDQLNAQNLINAKYQQEFLKKVLTHVTEKDISDSPAIQIYYQVYKTITEKDKTEPYFKLKHLLFQFHSFFTKTELKDLYVFAINYCIKKHNAEISEFKTELFELYKTGLELDVFINNGILSRFTYKNVVAAGINLKQFQWVENFIHENKNKLDLKWREDFFNICLAIMYYQIPDYKKAMALLQKAEFDDLFIRITARKMLLKIYYELKELDALESFLDSFHRYLTRHNKDLGYHQPLYVNFIKFIRKMLSIPSYDKLARLNLKKEVEQTNDVTEKHWLIAQLS